MTRTPLDVKGKHVFLVGGGSGIGLAVLRQIVPRGANVSFATKDPSGAAPIVKELEAMRVDPAQKVVVVKGFMKELENSERAVREAIEAQGGQAPDLAVLCAGFAPPGFFIDMSPETLKSGMDMQYWSNAWPAWVLSKALKEQGKTGHIVFVSNILSEISWAGYSAYAPGKFALRGLVETLRVELAPHIKCSLMLFSGGFAHNWDMEYSTKPDITKLQDQEHNYHKMDENEGALKIIDAIERGVDGRL